MKKATSRTTTAKAQTHKAPARAKKAAPARTTKAPAQTIDAYLSEVSSEQKAALEKLRKQIRTLLPKAEEVISYGLPAFRLDARVVIGFGAGLTHCALYPWSGRITGRFATELEGYETSKGAIRFQPDKPLPLALLRKIVKARLEDNANK